MRGLPLQLKVALNRKLRGPSMCFSYVCDIISMGVSTTRHGQTSGRLVQELNVRTVNDWIQDTYRTSPGSIRTSAKLQL